jgi:hypothetical protein
MARDYPISLCGGCELRPLDTDTGCSVEGRLRLGEREHEGFRVAVVYSELDPSYNMPVAIAHNQTTNEAIRLASTCTSSPEGLEAGLGDAEKRIQQQRAAAAKRVCKVTQVLLPDATLPADLLFQTQRS